MQQITIYDLLDEPIPKTESQKTRIDTGDWCLVYMVTRHGGYQGNLYMLHRDDAIKLCSDDCSRGYGRGGGVDVLLDINGSFCKRRCRLSNA